MAGFGLVPQEKYVPVARSKTFIPNSIIHPFIQPFKMLTTQSASKIYVAFRSSSATFSENDTVTLTLVQLDGFDSAKGAWPASIKGVHTTIPNAVPLASATCNLSLLQNTKSSKNPDLEFAFEQTVTLLATVTYGVELRIKNPSAAVSFLLAREDSLVDAVNITRLPLIDWISNTKRYENAAYSLLFADTAFSPST